MFYLHFLKNMSEKDLVEGGSQEVTPGGEREQVLKERTRKLIETLDVFSYPEIADREAGFDAQAFNRGLAYIYASMQDGSFFGNIVEITNNAFQVMKLYWESIETPPTPGQQLMYRKVVPKLSTSYTGQMLCATIYGLTQGNLKEDKVVVKAKAVEGASGESEKMGAQDELFQTKMDQETPFQLPWFDSAQAMVAELRKHNTEHPDAKMFLAPVSYKPMPSKDELTQEFTGGMANHGEVNEVFDGRPFIPHPACEGMDETDGMRIMCLRTFKNSFTSGPLIEEMEARTTTLAPNGFRPSIEKDLLYYFRVDPQPSRFNWVVAFGARVLHDGTLYHAVLNNDPAYPGFRHRPINYGWNSKNQGLFIAK